MQVEGEPDPVHIVKITENSASEKNSRVKKCYSAVWGSGPQTAELHFLTLEFFSEAEFSVIFTVCTGSGSLRPAIFFENRESIFGFMGVQTFDGYFFQREIKPQTLMG